MDRIEDSTHLSEKSKRRATFFSCKRQMKYHSEFVWRAPDALYVVCMPTHRNDSSSSPPHARCVSISVHASAAACHQLNRCRCHFEQLIIFRFFSFDFCDFNLFFFLFCSHLLHHRFILFHQFSSFSKRNNGCFPDSMTQTTNLSLAIDEHIFSFHRMVHASIAQLSETNKRYTLVHFRHQTI